MSRRDRIRRKIMIDAIVTKQRYVNELRKALEDLSPGTYWVYDNLNPDVLVEKAGTIH